MRIIATSCLIILLGVPAWAQQLVSAKAGTISYAEGIVYLNEAPLEFVSDRLQVVQKGQSLRTDLGRAEVQLGTYASLWLDNNAKLRMEDSNLTNPQLRVESGSIIVEIIEKLENNKITMRFGESVFTFEEIGICRFDSKNPQLSVYEGKADILKGNKKAKIKQGRRADLLRNLKLSKFDIKQRDQFRTWVDSRSGLLYGAIKETRRRQQRQQILEAQRRQELAAYAERERQRNAEMMQQADQASQRSIQQQQNPARSNDATPPVVTSPPK
jgi:hypothetical protein